MAKAIWPHAPQSINLLPNCLLIKLLASDEMLMLRLLPALESVPEPRAQELTTATAITTCYHCSIELAILRIAAIYTKSS